jgi:adenylate cyclase
VRDHLRHRGSFVFEDLGEQLVKNITHPIRAFRFRIGEEKSEQQSPSPEENPELSELPSAPAALSDLSADNEVALELALWDSVKDGSPAELESYLEQYPEGTFASLARTRLDTAAQSSAIEPVAQTPAEIAADALDLAFWDSVKDSNRREELQAYLEQHPNGHFAGLARARLSSSEAP